MREQKKEARRVLVNDEIVDMDSLPRSLRHIFEGEALREAIEIVDFLNAFGSNGDRDWAFGAWNGLCHVLDLLRDKIEIGAGLYKFPMGCVGDDHPPWRRVKENKASATPCPSCPCLHPGGGGFSVGRQAVGSADSSRQCADGWIPTGNPCAAMAADRSDGSDR
jgi:hypothetical protein